MGSSGDCGSTDSSTTFSEMGVVVDGVGGGVAVTDKSTGRSLGGDGGKTTSGASLDCCSCSHLWRMLFMIDFSDFLRLKTPAADLLLGLESVGSVGCAGGAGIVVSVGFELSTVEGISFTVAGASDGSSGLFGIFDAIAFPMTSAGAFGSSVAGILSTNFLFSPSSNEFFASLDSFGPSSCSGLDSSTSPSFSVGSISISLLSAIASAALAALASSASFALRFDRRNDNVRKNDDLVIDFVLPSVLDAPSVALVTVVFVDGDVFSMRLPLPRLNVFEILDTTALV